MFAPARLLARLPSSKGGIYPWTGLASMHDNCQRPLAVKAATADPSWELLQVIGPELDRLDWFGPGPADADVDALTQTLVAQRPYPCTGRLPPK